MQHHIPAIELPATGTRRILTGLLDSIGDRLTTEAAISDVNIHEMRKTCKKLRALLRMLRPAMDRDSFHTLDRAIRDFARQLAGLRDSKVMLDTIEHIEHHFAPVLHEQALTPVHQALRRMMQTQDDRPAVSLDLAAMQTQLADIMTAAGQANYGAIDDATLLDGIVDCYRRGRRAFAHMQASPDTESGHALRRQAKYQYYQLRMLVAGNESELKNVVSDFHRLEETLGTDHDLAVLEELLVAHAEICPEQVHRELLHALIESRRIILMSQALQLARKLYRDKPGKYRQWLETAYMLPADL